MISEKRSDIVAELRMNILRLEGFKSSNNPALDNGLGPMKSAFPNGSFPLGAVHEFLSSRTEDSTATTGFISGLLSTLMGNTGTTLWISTARKIFPPALRSFGLSPERFIFLDLKKEKDVVWAMDEALKCSALTAIIGETKEISFNESRRLQLAAEQSQATGFILRHNSRNSNQTACVSRWKISPLPSNPIDIDLMGELPGIGYPKWRVELTRIRNGKSGSWDIQWMNRKFTHVYKHYSGSLEQQKKTG